MPGLHNQRGRRGERLRQRIHAFTFTHCARQQREEGSRWGGEGRPLAGEDGLGYPAALLLHLGDIDTCV